MRGALVLVVILSSLPKCLMQPWIGVLVFSWISFMNPHRYAWGPARSFPVALVVAITTIVGLALTRDKQLLPKNSIVILMLLLWMVFCVSTPFAINQKEAWPHLIAVSKSFFMVFVSLKLINDPTKLRYLLIVIALSLGFIGTKGGLWAIMTGGVHRVYGPQGTFIGDNNDLALALNMTLPIMFYLSKDESRLWLKNLLRISFVMSIVAVVFTYSRGGFLALCGVIFLLLFKARYKSIAVFVLILGIIVGTIIVPDKWSERMGTIQTYDQDKSSLGRLNAWATAWNLALDRPLVGGGFEVFFVRGVFAKYAPDPTNVRDVHSIYFEMLGEQGFPGFIIFVLLLSTALLVLVRLKSQVSKETSLQWGKYFPDMLQVSIIGYLVGGAFLGRAYFDLLYQLLAVVCLLNKFVFQQVAEKSRKSATSSGAIIFQPMLPSAGGRRGV